MADYKWADIDEDLVLRRLDGAIIPKDPLNTDWKEYLKYVSDGGLTDQFETATEQREREFVDNIEWASYELERMLNVLTLNKMSADLAMKEMEASEKTDLERYSTELGTYMAGLVTTKSAGTVPIRPLLGASGDMAKTFGQYAYI